MNTKSVLIVLALLLLGIGILKPNLSLPINNPNNNDIVIVTPPMDENLKKACQGVIDSLQKGDSSRAVDAKRLSSLYMDLSTLVELDGSDTVIKTTDELRQANSLSGLMLKMNIKSKYPELASAANAVIVAGIGDDMVTLDDATRSRAVETFRALAWACNEGSK